MSLKGSFASLRIVFMTCSTFGITRVAKQSIYSDQTLAVNTACTQEQLH